MKLLDLIKNRFIKEEINETEETNEIEEFEMIIEDEGIFGLYLKNREKKYILVKDFIFSSHIQDIDMEFIDMNKDILEYYREFRDFKSLTREYLKLEEARKNEDDYLKEYLEHSESDYSKIIEKMKCFELDKFQYEKLLKNIKNTIEESIEKCYNNFENSNPQLETDRTYKKIKENLISSEKFFEQYSSEYYDEFKYKEGSISHCGYPDYMWQSGIERNIYTFI